MITEKKTKVSKIIMFFVKTLVLIGIVIAFYKLPGVVAEKISYWKIRNKKITQEYEED